MRYWQITTARLSKAARKLDYDGSWHPFQSALYSWYRVWKKRLIQRVNFANSDEENMLLPLVEQIEPLPEMATVTGFREELNVTVGDETYRVTIPLGYEPPNIADVQKTFSSYNISLSLEGNLLYAHLPLAALTTADLTEAQSQLSAVRLFFQAATMSEDKNSLEAARKGFEKMMSSINNQS